MDLIESGIQVLGQGIDNHIMVCDQVLDFIGEVINGSTVVIKQHGAAINVDHQLSVSEGPLFYVRWLNRLQRPRSDDLVLNWLPRIRVAVSHEQG